MADTDVILLAAPNTDNKGIDYSTKYTKTTSSSLTSLDTITSILKDPQNWTNFKRLLEFCDYYINYDSIVAGAIKNILIPFSQPEYRLTGGDEKSVAFFNNWLNDINFKDVLAGIANDFHKYGQSYVYLHDDDSLQVLPVFRCIVESMAVKGEPVISFELDRTVTSPKTDITDIERRYAGYPKEISEAATKGGSYARLELGHTFGVCGTKAYWERYSLPILTAALPWLLEKETLNSVLMNELDNMKRSFLEVQVGDKEFLPKPNRSEYDSVTQAYKQAISTSGTNLAIVSWNVNSKWVQANSKEVLTNIADAVAFVNWNILSALSMSPILAAGDAPPNKATASSFSTTQAAIGVINRRINTLLSDIEKIMYKIMTKVGVKNKIKSNNIPRIVFEVVDLGKEDRFNEELLNLYNNGLLSIQTVLNNSDFDYTQELENKTKEMKDGVNELFKTPKSTSSNETSSEVGRPILDNSERTSDLDQSLKNEIPTPSDVD